MTTDNERAALEWLDLVAASDRRGGHCDTIKAMLARPRLPDVTDHKAIDAIERGFIERGLPISRVRIVLMLELIHRMHEQPKPKVSIRKAEVPND